MVPESNAYYHIVGVWDKDRKKARIYVNGRLKNEIDINGDNYIAPKTGATKFCIGVMRVLSAIQNIQVCRMV